MATGGNVTSDLYSVFLKNLLLLKSATLEASLTIAPTEKSLGSMTTNSLINNNLFPGHLAKATF